MDALDGVALLNFMDIVFIVWKQFRNLSIFDPDFEYSVTSVSEFKIAASSSSKEKKHSLCYWRRWSVA